MQMALDFAKQINGLAAGGAKWAWQAGVASALCADATGGMVTEARSVSICIAPYREASAPVKMPR